jgi:hypothetical protein
MVRKLDREAALKTAAARYLRAYRAAVETKAPAVDGSNVSERVTLPLLKLNAKSSQAASGKIAERTLETLAKKRYHSAWGRSGWIKAFSAGTHNTKAEATSAAAKALDEYVELAIGPLLGHARPPMDAGFADDAVAIREYFSKAITANQKSDKLEAS